MELRTVQGSLLAAAPDLLDPNFMHSVVLMCQHDDRGAFGLVVNRPAEVTLAQLLPDHPDLGAPEFPAPFPVHRGGPVGLDTLQFVHTVPDAIPDGIELLDGVLLGGDFEAAVRFLAADPRAAAGRLRMIVGYSGWAAGQLEAELAIGSWLPAAARPEWIFGADTQRTWRHVVRSVGRDVEGLQDLPPDTSWN